ncbi:Oligosaccharide translocation protein rft1 [Puccinia graminis f. sp. tritici]|uniref:Man(5)GlcNAc(2)-PP-dolichol translocation protein RFT1 n=1 Tax=Puccinia graminis f. sp. tritici TaxID=56615 RepID=A0A5B0QDW0_PUCGR|nr:Oligosaccharide translocation protein rft1 [Puccinia graminis f. sp. tritici]
MSHLDVTQSTTYTAILLLTLVGAPLIERRMTTELLTTGLSLIGLQLISRLLTFILNQTLVRVASPEALGTASIQFDVLINTVLFFSREGVRGGLSRTQDEFNRLSNSELSSSNQKHPPQGSPSSIITRRQEIVNASFLPIPIGILFSFVLFLIYWLTVDQSTANQAHFQTALIFYLVAVLCELLSEPAYIHLILAGQTGRRVKVEGTAVSVKTLTTLFVVMLGYHLGHDWGLLGFATGQLAYSFSLTFGLWSPHFRARSAQLDPPNQALYPRQTAESQLVSSKAGVLDSWIAQSDLNLCYALTRQSIIKQFLTEGDKMIISKICPIAHQGGYALAMNYGSLVARILFQPIEETSRLYFSRNLSASRLAEKGSDSSSKNAVMTTGLRGSIDLLTNLIQCHLYLGLVFVTFGPPYVRLGLWILLGPRSAYLRDGPSSTIIQVLRAYCSLLPLLGMNGILEGFVQSAADEKELDQMSKLMALWCAIFVAAVALFSSSWASGTLLITAEVAIVIATGVNMICRILYGWKFSGRYVHRRAADRALSLSKAAPSAMTILAFIFASIFTRWSESGYSGALAKEKPTEALLSKAVLSHLLNGIGSLCGCFLVIAVSERSRLKEILSTVKNQPKTE